MRVLAIDPGKRGGVAVFDAQADDFEHICPLPYEDDRVNVGALQSLIIEYAPDAAAIEVQQTRGRQANQGIIALNYGRLTAVCDLCDLPVFGVLPQQWQTAIHGKPTSDKVATYNWLREQGYFVPNRTADKRSTFHDGIADAMALALFSASAIAIKLQEVKA